MYGPCVVCHAALVVHVMPKIGKPSSPNGLLSPDCMDQSNSGPVLDRTDLIPGLISDWTQTRPDQAVATLIDSG